jgi:hypothetical protein
MADLFTRLAARSAGHAPALRPLPAATRAARPMRGDGDSDLPAPAATLPRLSDRTDPREDAGPAPAARRGADGDDAERGGAAPACSQPDGEQRAGPALRVGRAPVVDQHRREDSAPSAPVTLTEAIVALDAGAVVHTPDPIDAVVQPVTAGMSAPARRAARRRERDSARGPSVVQVSIGELVVRGAAPEMPARSPEPPPPAGRPRAPAEGLSLHDYLRGGRSRR